VPVVELYHPVPEGNEYRNLALGVGEVSTLRPQNMVMSPTGLRPEKDCAGEASQQLLSTDSSFRQGGCLTSRYPQIYKDNDNKETWSRAPDAFLTTKQTGRLTVGRNITLS
jgi:hypothetical protein